MYSNETVFEAALERTRWLFKEFPNVVVDISGGKDSTVVLNLALRVAEELGRLPLSVMFIDQEAEWQCVIDYVTTIMTDPRVKPYWLQIPIQLYNSTSQAEEWLWCWQEGADWIREKSPISIHENRYGTTRFAPLFSRFLDVEFPDAPACQIGGIRTEESPRRMMAVTAYPTYKWVTWGKKDNPRLKHYSFIRFTTGTMATCGRRSTKTTGRIVRSTITCTSTESRSTKCGSPTSTMRRPSGASSFCKRLSLTTGTGSRPA